MRTGLCLVILAIAAACDGPSLHFAGQEATRIAIDGSVFDVRVRGRLAEAIRVNPQYAPRLGPVGDRAVVAMAAVSGCRVSSLLGDQAVQVGRLDCGGPPPRGPVLVPDYDCLETPSGVDREDGVQYIDYDCSSY